MSKFIGKTEGLDPKKLSALRKVLKEAGIEGDIRINSGLRDAKKAYELYLLELKSFPKLKSALEKLPKGSKKAIKERILRGQYNPKGKSTTLYPSGKWDRPGLIRQLTKDGLSAVEAQKIAKQIAEFRDVNAGLGSSHLKGEKVDINRDILNKPGVKELLVEKGYVILDEQDPRKNIWDISFPKPGRKGSYKPVRSTSKPKKRTGDKTKKPFKQAFDEAREMGQKDFEWEGRLYSTRKKGESVEEFEEKFKFVDDQKFDSPKEFEEFKEQEIKEQEIIEPEVSPMGKQIEGMDMMDMQAPKPDLILPDAPPPNPYGVYARGEPEFEMAEEEQKVMMAANGGEVEEDFSMQEQVSEAVPRYLQRPEEGQQEQGFKLGGIDDLVSGLEETSSKAAQPELQKADEIIKEDVEVKVDAGPEMEREQLRIESMSDEELRDYPATAAGRPSAVNKEIRRRRSEKFKQEQIGRDPFLSETALTRTKDGIPGYIMAGDMEGLIRARDSKKFKPTVIEKEIGRRKKLIQKQAGLKRPPSIEDIIKIEKTKEVVEAPKAPKGDVSKREPAVRVTSDVEKQQSALQRQKAELDAKIQEFQKTESKYDAIDNQRFFNKGGTLNKIISMVAAGFGGYASGRYGGPNVYLDLIDKEVKSDIQQQKLDREDEVAKQNAAYKKIKQLADRYQMAVDNDFAKKKLDLLSKKMDQKIAVNRNKLAVQNLKQQDYSRITKPLSRKAFTELDFKYPDMKLRDRAMTGRDGQVFIVDSAATKKKLEEQIENNTGAVQAIDQLIELTPKLSMFEKFPGAGRFSVNRKVADATRDALVGKLRLELFGPGVMTDTEREQAKKIIGDPGALFEMDKTKIAALQNIRWKLKYAERERLRRAGVQVPMSPNDLKVENRLKNLGYPPFAKASPKQKRIAMDILINAEKAAMRKAKAGKAEPGYYKGKFWDKDEQGNF